LKNINLETIHLDLEMLKKGVGEIKIEINAVNGDVFLTDDEMNLVEESFKNEKEGKLISSDELKFKLQIRGYINQ